MSAQNADPCGETGSLRPVVLDLFAGPGGWSEGLRMLGLSDVGIEWDEAACATRAAAGHLTVRADVAAYPTTPFAGKVVGLIASPPCQDFSMAGKRAGRTGEKGQLIDDVPRWVDDLRPEWVALEQVPPALTVWQEFAHLFRSWGYSAWSGILNAADYGVPQTRERAILIASLAVPALPPEPTHAEAPAVSMFGAQRKPWRTMGDALGWHGFEAHYQRGAGMVERYGERPGRRDDEPAPTLTGAALGGGGGAKLRIFTNQGNPRDGYYSRPSDEASPTLTGMGRSWRVGGDAAYRNLTVAEALTLQSFRPGYPVQGNKSKRFEQIGNAVPPLLAAHVLGALTGQSITTERAA